MEFFKGRTGLLIVAAAVALLWSVAPAPTQGQDKSQATGKGHKNKVIIYPKAGETIDQLKKRGFNKVDNYGSYWVATATDEQVDSLNKTHGDRAVKANYLNRIELAATPIDTTAGEPSISSGLRQSATTGKRLVLIQFKGPVQPKWLQQVKAAGNARIVSYVPNNAYIVWLDAAAEDKLAGLMDPNGPIQWKGAYHPYYKIAQDLRTITESGPIKVRVAIVDDPQESLTMSRILALGLVENSFTHNGQKTLAMEMLPSVVSQIAQLPAVLWIEKVRAKRPLDEVQDLILTSQTNGPGHGPSTSMGITNYLDFLTNSVGGGLASFQNQFTYPIVDVADTGFNATYEAYPGSALQPSFNEFGINGGVSRLAYQAPGNGGYFSGATVDSGCAAPNLNFIGTEDFYDHGTRVASVIAGYDTQTNSSSQCSYFTIVTNTFTDTEPCPPSGTGTVAFTFATLPCPLITNLLVTCGSLSFSVTTNLDLPTQINIITSVSEDHQDPSGFQYGLGISPFGRVGSSRIWRQTVDTTGTPPHVRFLPSPQQPVPCMDALYPRLFFEAYSNGGRIQNNSWAAFLDAEGLNGGRYGPDAPTFDTAVRDALLVGTSNNVPGPSALNQEFIIVFAAASLRTDAGASGNVGGFGDIRVTDPATAKNVISVGASENVRLDGSGCAIPADQDNSFDVWEQSAFGPTVDGRFKPEIVAPGTTIWAAQTELAGYIDPVNGITPTVNEDPCGFFSGNTVFSCSSTNLYCSPSAPFTACFPNASGTIVVPSGLYDCRSGSSYAAPAISGGIQLLWWYFQNRLTNEQGQHLLQPSPAMAKAYLLNSARYLPITNAQTQVKDTLPSTAQGMGEMDLLRMFDGVTRVIRDESTPRAIDTPLTTTNPAPQQTYFSQSGQSYELTGQIASNGLPFRVTLAWTDAPGSPNNFVQLVNDLDLEVTVNGVTYKGNVFSEDHSVPGGGFDSVNNVESVFLTNGTVFAGQAYSVIVRAKSINGDGVPNVGGSLGQDFALVIYNSQTNFPGLSDVPNLTTNNACQTAITITNSSFVFTNTLRKLVYANVQPSPSAGQGGVDEFFKIPLPAAGTLVTLDTAGSAFSNVLSVWSVQVLPQPIYVRGECGALTEVISDNSGGWTNVLSFVADGSNDYYIVVEPQNNVLPFLGAQMVLNVNSVRSSVLLSPVNVDFGDQVVGSTSTPVTVSIVNSGTTPVTISNISLTGSSPVNFLFTTNCAETTILPDNSCSVTLNFNPQILGTNTDVLLISTSETNAPHRVFLKGVGVPSAPIVAISPSTLSFGDQSLRTTSAVQSVTITNIGSANLVITNLSFSGGNAPNDFLLPNVITNGCIGVSIPSNGVCTIDVTFAPTQTGARATQLRIFSNAGITNLVVTGVGIAPVIQFAPASLNFQTQQVNVASAPQSVILENIGNGPLTISSVTVVGTNAANFSITTNSCLGTPIASGDACSISVTFRPTSQTNNTASLRIVSDATNSPPVDVPLSGFGGTGLPSIGFNPSQLSFGNQVLGTTSSPPLTVIVTNAGTTSLVITNVNFDPTTPNPGDFIVTNNTCLSVAIPPGGTCNIGAVFHPTGTGARSSKLQVWSNSGGVNPAKVDVSGNGVAPAMVLQPNPLNFGTQAVSIASTPLTVNVLSVGDSVLSVTNVLLIGTNAAAFTVVNNCAGAAVPPGSSCGLTVTFTPVVLGSNTAQLVVYGTATNSPQVVNLTGVGANTAPSLQFSPAQLVFGNQPLGTTSAVLSVTVSNNGNAVLAITNAVFAGAQAGDFLVTNNLCGSIAPGGVCTIGAVFRPTVLGARSATLQIFNNSGVNPVSVPVSGNGTAPAIGLDTTSVSFGTQAVSIASAPLTINVLSVGNAPLTITNVVVVGTNAADFAVTANTCLGSAVPPGSSCGVSLSFTPGALGLRTAQVQLWGNATNSPQIVNLSGVGTNTAPSIQFNPLTVGFGNQSVGTTSLVQSITVSNAGNASLAITNLDFVLFNPGDFIVTNATCLGVPLAPGATCTIGVAFRPTATGQRRTDLRVFSNSGINPYFIPVSGFGVVPVMVLQPSPLNFNTQAVSIASAPLTVNVLNVGDSVLSVTNVVISGVNTAAFSVVNNCAGSAVPPGSSCGLTVTFTPVVLGSNTATLQVWGTATNSPQTVSLTGVGANTAPSVGVTPTSLSFGNQPLNTTSAPPLSVVVSNTGNAVLAITNVVFSGGNAGDFIVTNNLCGSIPPGGTCTIGAVFRPTVLGARASSLQIYNNSGVNPVSVPVSGNGVAPAMVLQPNPLNFNTQAVSIASAPLTVNVLNVGDSVLTVTNVLLIGTNAAAFSVVNNCAGAAVPPGSSCGLTVTFTPVVLGSNTAQLVVYGTATNSPQVVNLSGVGANTAPSVGVTPTSLSFGNQALNTTSSPPLSVVVSNTGNAVLAITNVVFAGGNAGDFIVTNNLCGSIAPGGVCTLQAVFRPGGLGARASTLQIYNNSGVNPVSVPVSGNGVAPAMVLQPNPLNFGTQAVSIASTPLTVNVLSVGDSVLSVTNVLLIGTNAAAFTVVNNCAGAAVPPGSSCGLTVTFTPVVLGSNTAQLVVYGTATNSPQVVNLTGVGANTAPSLQFSPAQLVFGNQPLGTTSAVLSVTVSNNGNAVLAITNAVFAGAQAGDFLVTNNLCGSIAPGGVCTIGAVFRPTVLGARSATLQIFNNSGVNPVSVPVSGNGTAPAIGLDTTSVSFGTQAVSIASAPLTINVLSVGNAPLTITNVVVVGTNAADFAVTANTCLGSAVPPGSSCGVSLSFTPGALGLRTAQVQLWGNATNSPQIVNLSGVGTNTAPSIQFNPLTVGFGNQSVGTTSLVQSITVSNAGNASLAITNLDFVLFNPGDFIVTNATCLGVPLAPGATCTIGVAFRPTATGQRRTDLRVFSNSGINPYFIPVSGFGVVPVMVLQPSPLNFNTQAVSIASAPLTVNVLNVGDSVLSVTNVVISGVNTAAFSVVNNCAGSAVPPGSSCGLTVTFTPVVLGSNTATLQVWGTATNSPQTVSLTGVGANTAPSVGVTPTSLSFGNQPLNTTSAPPLSVVVSNTGNAVLAITNVVFSGGNAGDFIVTNNLCGSIPPGGTCTIGAVFRPTVLGARASSLQIYNNSGVNPVSVPVSGNGVAPAMVLQPNPLNFNTQAVSIASAPLTVNVLNVGDSVLTVTNVLLIGTNAAAFSVVNNCAGAAVPPGSSCGLTVTFTPVVLGSNTAQLVVYGTATNSPQVVNLSGVGANTAPSVQFSPEQLLFGNQPLATTSSVLSVTVSNTGNAVLAITNAVFSGGNAGDFIVTNNLCGSIPPGGTCTIGALFKPSVLGARASTLQIFNNSGVNPVSVPVSGNGTAPSIGLGSTSVNFGTQSVSVASSPQFVIVQSIGDAPLVITNVTVIGANAADFTITTNPCLSAALAPGDSCGISISFRPSAIGARAAQLVISGNATNSPQLVNLSGVGATNAPALLLDRVNLLFGDQLVGTTSAVQQVTVSNPGSAALIIGSIGFSGGDTGDFIIVTNTCLGAPIPSGGNCTFQIAAAPRKSGLLSTAIRILSNAGNGTNLVPVTGSGIAPVVTLSTSVLDFGTNVVNTTSLPRSVFVLNSGNAALVIQTTDVVIAGVNAGDFSNVLISCTNTVVLPGQSCQIQVVFRTTTTLPRTALLVINSNATNTPQFVVLNGVGAPFGCPPIFLVPPTLPNGGLGTFYSQTISAIGGVGSNLFQVTAGSLPTGLLLNPDGLLSGVPTAFGTFNFTVQAQDANGCTGSAAYAISIGCPPLSLAPAAFPSGAAGSPYLQTNTVSGGTPPISFAITAGSLPPGLTYGTNGVLSGSPTTVGNYSFTVTATDGNSCAVSRAYTLSVICSPLTLLPQTLPNAALATPYSQILTAGGTTNTVTYIVSSGNLPPGLTLSSAGIVSGTPTLQGTFTFQVTAIDVVTSCTGQRFYTIKVNCSSVALSPATLPVGSVGTPYNQTFTASGGTAPYNFSQTGGSLPFGMTLASNGVLSGTPLSGSTIFTIQVTDANGCSTNLTYTLVLANNCPPITVLPGSLPPAVETVPYNQTVTATGGVAPHTFAVYSGSLPPGMSLATDGTLSGAPLTTGTVSFTVVALDGSGCAGFQTYSLNVSCATINITPASLPTGTVTVAYSQSLLSTGGVAPLTFAISSGTLPTGLTLDSSGLLSGTPADVGNFAFTATATDAAGCAGSRLYSLAINPAADLAVTVSDSPDPIAVGSGVLTYSIIVTNRGPSIASGVTMTSVVPASGASIVTVGGGTFASNIATWVFGVIPAGGSAPVSMTVSPLTSGLLTNTLTVTSGVFDPNLANNTAIAVTTVTPAVLFSAATEIASASAGAAIVNVTRLGRTDTAVTVEYATSDGTAVAGTDYAATSGVLNFDSGVSSRSFNVPLIASAAQGRKIINLALKNPTGGAVLGSRAMATIEIVNSAKPSPTVFTNSVNDIVTVKLAGSGAMQVSLVNTNGPIDQITVTNTDTKSSLTVTVKRLGGNGEVEIGSIVGAGSLKNINAKSGELIGSGINLGGALGKLQLHSISNTTVSASNGISSVSASEITGSLITAGFVPTSPANPLGGGTFAAGILIKSIKANAFASSTIAAAQIGTVNLKDVNTNNVGVAFGVLANESIKAVKVTDPKFMWGSADTGDKSTGDFHVKKP